jgi:hypothetical protein
VPRIEGPRLTGTIQGNRSLPIGADHPGLCAATSNFVGAEPAPYRRIFRVPGLCGQHRLGPPGLRPSALERPATDIARRAALEAGRSAKCLAPAGTGGYPRHMEISPNWGNFPRRRVQVPPRTLIHAPDLRLFVWLHVNLDKTADHSPRGSSPSRTHAYVHELGSSIADSGASSS